jgi:HAD superfamily hydrolase (TIGR01509 family)
MNRAIIFDMDGVIVLSEQADFDTFNEILKEYNKKIDKKFYHENISGAKSIDCWRSIFKNKPKQFLEMLSQRFDSLFQKKFIKNIKPAPGIKKLLQSLNKYNYLIGLATGNDRSNEELILDNLGIKHFFHSITTGDEVIHAKPHPTIYRKASNKAKIKPENCIVIEDAVLGVRAAKKAGMKCIAVTTTQNRKDLKKAGADFIVPNLTKININLIKKIGGE